MRPLLFCLIAVLLPWAGSSHGSALDNPAARRLSDKASGDVTIRYRRGTDMARFVRVPPGGNLAPELDNHDADGLVRAFLARHRSLFGLADAGPALQLESQRRDMLGHTHLKYAQRHDGVPVYGARLLAAVDDRQRLTTIGVGTRAVDGLATSPGITAARARTQALQTVSIDRMRYTPVHALTASPATLVIHDPGLATPRPGTPVLAWRVVVSGTDLRQQVFVDALTARVIDRIEGLEHALDRRVYDGGFGETFEVWREGDAVPFGQLDIDRLIDHSRETYNLYATLTGGEFLSWDGAGAPMHSVLNPPGFSCPNASWNGQYSRYCSGYTADDVVAHEYTHGYTDATHDLIYRWQSGALNEAYADIFGEVVDILNGAGLDEPDLLRSASDCSVFGGHLPPIEVLSPAALAGVYAGGAAQFNPPGATATAQVALARDSSAPETDGCDTITNAAELDGRIAVVENHGRCAGLIQVRNAQAAGASGVLLVNTFSDVYYDLPGVDPAISIPTAVVGTTLGASITASAKPPVIRLAFSDVRDPSIRWLHREEFQSFSGTNGPNRDMWQPSCFGDPGRVGDPLYHCQRTDSGGVHHNSGIVNHLFALLVDGGNFNGRIVPSTGLTRAAHLYWRAMAYYQRPDTDFAGHADALEAGCADLAASGQPLPALRVDTDKPVLSAIRVTPETCQALASAIAAVQLRDLPTCEFAPLLAPNPPPVCGDDTLAVTYEHFDFEAGLADWQSGRRAVADITTFDGEDWQTQNGLPHGRAGSAAFAPDLIAGNCADDTEAGVLYLQSPPLVAPAAERSPWVVFDHLPATESDYDGGNVKISIADGPWQLVPANAFRHNPYTSDLRTSDNPMGGEPAWHGSDDNRLTSDWGTSQIELDAQLAPGDSFRLRFELGSDGCNGLLGWYVDDVTVLSCPARPDTDADGIPDAADNCRLTGNADQRDSNGDGFGNLCDADLDNDGLVSFGDLAAMRAVFASNDADADLDGDGTVGFADLGLLRSMFLLPPGPGAAVTPGLR